MSSQRGNTKRTRAQKYQNKAAFKNVYHDTSKQTQKIVSTEVSGVCARCKDCIDWKIKYKKYKPLTQAKTCVLCKQKTIKHAYHVMCNPCAASVNKCAKCGEKKDVVLKPTLSDAAQASQDRELEFELEQLPERKRRTYLRLQEKGLLPAHGEYDDDDDDNDEDMTDSEDDDINTEVTDIREATEDKTVSTELADQCKANDKDEIITEIADKCKLLDCASSELPCSTNINENNT